MAKEKNFIIAKTYLEEPRLQMSVPGRFMVRVSAYIGYSLLIALMFGMFISDLAWLRGIGILILLFLVDRLVHIGEPDKPLSEIKGDEKAGVNVAQFITTDVYQVIERAFDQAILRRDDFYVECLKQLFRYPEIEEGIRRLDIKVEELVQKIEALGESSLVKQNDSAGTAEKLRKNIEVLLDASLAHAIAEGHRFVEVGDVLLGLLSIGNEPITRTFGIFKVTADDLRRALIFGFSERHIPFLQRLTAFGVPQAFETHRVVKHQIMNRAWTSRPTPTLDKFSEDMTDLARTMSPGFFIGHKVELERAIDALTRTINPNALLVGEAGSGKRALIEHLSLLITQDKVPEGLFDKRVVALHISNLVASAEPQELQARLKNIVEEITIAGNIILVIPDIHNLLKTSGEAFLSAADALMPIIMDGAFPIIGATYPKEMKQYLEPRSDFMDVFELIRMQEISESEAEEILVYQALVLERQYKVTVSFGAIKEAVRLAKAHFREKLLPASATELLKEGIVEAERRGEKFIGIEEIIKLAEAKTNVPMHKATKAEASDLLHLEEHIHERFVDQEEAVISVSNALREYRSGLARGKGPIATFLFVGPSGVGKTELAKIVARIQFGSEEAMVRFDMTEYQDKQSTYRFIGMPDGSISGALTEAVRQKPYSLVLLDEFEKAHPDILNLFLQVFDDGRLTDNIGRTIDFQNTIIIATSNAHSDIINEALNRGEKMDAIAEYLKKKLVDIMKPELINRFSRIVVFKDLAPVDLERIAEFALQDLVKGLKEQGITLTFTGDVAKYVAKVGYDPVYGARPIRRVIEDKIRAPLASELLKRGDERGITIQVSVTNNEFTFS